MKKLLLYHTGYEVIEKPDVHYGRKNADFGQGFYLSDDREFSKRWARERQDRKTILNAYELDPEGLRIRDLSRNEEWFEYIYGNRNGREDPLPEYDVIRGPIANDTLYDTWGVITSGLLEKRKALRLFLIGPCYTQIVLKAERAVSALRFLGAEEISEEEVRLYRKMVREEEKVFQEEFLEMLEEIMEGERR